MVYTEYKNASERHLETCLFLLERLSKLEQKNNLNRKEIKSQKHLLSNLYYLSGYMLECLYSYAMCKNQNIPREGNVKNILDGAEHGTYKICFTYNKKRRLNVEYSIVRPQHRMSLSELSYFQAEGVISEPIPLLDNSTQLSNSNSQSLFENWTVFERYKFNHYGISNFPEFNHQNVTTYFWEIVDVCAKMSEQILRELSPFRKAIKKRP